jgi:hypothetical protein
MHDGWLRLVICTQRLDGDDGKAHHGTAVGDGGDVGDGAGAWGSSSG